MMKHYLALIVGLLFAGCAVFSSVQDKKYSADYIYDNAVLTLGFDVSEGELCEMVIVDGLPFSLDHEAEIIASPYLEYTVIEEVDASIGAICYGVVVATSADRKTKQEKQAFLADLLLQIREESVLQIRDLASELPIIAINSEYVDRHTAIEKIEVLSNKVNEVIIVHQPQVNTAIFGTRGANGLIVIYSK